MLNDRRARLLLSVLAGLTAAAPTALAQLRVCAWNVTNYGTTSTARNGFFQTAFYGAVPAGLALAGQSMSPDAIIGQEFTSATAVTNFRNLLNSAPGSPGDWAAAPYLNGNDSDSAFFYRTSKVQFINRWRISIGGAAPEPPRDTLRYDFRPLGYTADSTVMSAYSIHFMSQGGDAARRALEALRIKNNANGADTNPGDSANPAGSTGKPAAYALLVGGDTNVQTSSDQAWVNLTGSSTVSTGPFFDPIRASGNWNNNSGFRFLHTQDPRVTGMDDRFDVLLIGASLRDGSGLEYIGNTNAAYSTSTWNDPNHSYRCWGNDGGAYGVSLRTAGNTMVGPVIAQALIDSTNDGGSSGGHLPIIADLRVPAVFSSSADSVAFGQVLQGDGASTVITITNTGDVSRWTVSGIAPLRYTMSVTGPFTVSGSGAQQTEAPGGGGNAHTVTMDTSTPGPRSGSITIATDAPDTPTFTIALSGNVQSPPPPTCTADLGHQGGLPGPDGQLDNNDFIAFIAAFFALDPAADLGHQGGLPGGDGQFDNNDFIAFIAAFFAGCP